MGLRLEMKLTGVPDEQIATLQVLTTNIHGIVEHLALDLGIPGFDVTVVVASDFAGEVSAVLRSVEGDNGEVLTTERIGGAVMGKCIPLAHDCSDQVVVLDGAAWPLGDPSGQAWVISLLAHELTHVVLGRPATPAARSRASRGGRSTAWTGPEASPGSSPRSIAST